ncbi:MAG: D-serine ammonia-lyase [Peptostreptococcaceae bacterium]|nr:D-serine ammonia-lyase [Peptostreptococcaceae bacterium]
MSDKSKLLEKYPKLQAMREMKEVLWLNEELEPFEKAMQNISVKKTDMMEASERLVRFAPFIKSAFSQTQEAGGIIESPFVKIEKMKAAVEKLYHVQIAGDLFLKCDNALPISGSIKARGGIYEVLKHAEELAIEHKMLDKNEDYGKLDSDEMRAFFGKYHIAVGSTGNLGLSIGIMSAKLGFKVTVHMSSDAKAWKKALLREKGVEVIEYADDYSKAVEEGRRLSMQDPNSYFVDDENSVNLFMGYSVAALRLENQLKELGIAVDKAHPLFVYLPCGVGGGPGGVAFGLKNVFGDAVHFFFAEPTHSPCMLLGCMTKTHDKYSVQDFGIDNKTIADGLAVGRASGFVGKTLEHLVSGCFSVQDETMLKLLALMTDSENISLEPSALAGFGIFEFANDDLKKYIEKHDIDERNITHIAWATGGSMVPKEIQLKDYESGKKLLSK